MEYGSRGAVFNALEPAYAIGVTAHKIGVSPETLRLYERVGLLIPYRTGTGRRLYSQMDLEWISCIRRQIKEHGLNLAAIQRLLALVPCWEIKPCASEERNVCPALKSNDRVCWNLDVKVGRCAEEDCRTCLVYQRAIGVGHLKELYKLRVRSVSQE